jgi:hypothetical protein
LQYIHLESNNIANLHNTATVVIIVVLVVSDALAYVFVERLVELSKSSGTPIITTVTCAVLDLNCVFL